MRRFFTFEVCYSLGSGGSLVKRCKTLEEAKAVKGDREDLLIYKSYYSVSNSGIRYRDSSKRVG